MYSRKAWGGNTDPYILTKFLKPDKGDGNPTVSLVVFEWSDRDLIGHVLEEKNEYGFETVSIPTSTANREKLSECAYDG